MAISKMAENYQGSRKMLLFIVYVALFLDNMLLTTIVPIIPEYLVHLTYPNLTDEVSIDEAQYGRSIPRHKRDIVNPDSFLWDDNAWDLPANYDEDRINWDASPLNPVEGNEESRSRPPEKTKSKQPKSRERERISPMKNRTEERHDIFLDMNLQVGLMFGSKALVQLLTNPWIGHLTVKIGYTIPMFVGFCIMFTSTVLFAYGSSFNILWLARALQGIGSALTSTCGMGMVAQAYTDDEERGKAMGMALGGLALGVLVGPPYGGLLYQWFGKETPFVLLALLALFDGALQFFVLRPHVDKADESGSGLKKLICDPYIAASAGAITIGNLGIAVLEPSLPLWMMDTWNAHSLERGAAFLPASVSYLIGTNLFGTLAHKFGRSNTSFLGLIIIGIALLLVPQARSFTGLIVPNFSIGFAIGMVDASMFPHMGYIVDIRHGGVYGAIYAIADAAFCFAFALGPFFSGPLVKYLGFERMIYIVSVISIAYAPLIYLTRNPVPTKKLDEIFAVKDHTKALNQYGTTSKIYPAPENDYKSITVR